MVALLYGIWFAASILIVVWLVVTLNSIAKDVRAIREVLVRDGFRPGL